MIFSELIQGFLEHKEFIFFNHLVHVFAGAFIATVIFPFLNVTLSFFWREVLATL